MKTATETMSPGLTRLRQRFLDPPREYGPTPFFALNDELDPDRLRAALRLFSARGCAGVFMHPRTGMLVPYLSETFWERIAVVIEECQRLGLKAWIYDDYNWPSGGAGGFLLQQRPDFRMQCLEYAHPRLGPDTEPIHPGRALAAFDLRAAAKNLSEHIHDGRFRSPHDFDGQVLLFYQDTMNDRTFANHGAPWLPPVEGCLDYLNPEAVAAFIARTHDEYARRFSAHFGQTIPGVFTDEPQFYRGFPWTGRLAAEFQAACGYDLLERLFLLVTDRGDYRRLRCDYYQLVERLYAQSYFDQVRDWCDGHGLLFTGHLGMEEDVARHAVNHGGIYRPLRRFSMPGIDALGAGNPVSGGVFNMGCPHFAPRAAAAVARLAGHRVLCEAGGGAGFGTTLAQLKRQLDWLFAAGVNFINPHQSLLSLKGLRKRDFPPSIFEPEPWFEHYSAHASYIARLSSLLTEGEPAMELALLFPASTLRADEHGRGSQSSEFVIPFNAILEFLVSSQREFELLFEETAAEGLARVEGDRLLVGNQSFGLLAIPPCHTLAPEMAELVVRFLEGGGRVLLFDALPGRDSQGRDLIGRLLPPFRRALDAGRAAQISSRAGFSRESVAAALETLAPAKWKVLGEPAPGLMSLHRRLDGIDLYFLANLEDHALELDLAFADPRARLEVWDPVEGHSRPWSCEPMPGAWKLTRLDLEPGESLVLIWSDEPAPTEAAGEETSAAAPTTPAVVPPPAGKTPPLPLTLMPEWELRPERPNALLLEPWRVRTAWPPLPPRSEYQRDPYFNARTRRLIQAGRALYAATAPLRRLGPRLRTERFLDLVETERSAALVARVTGIDLDRFGLYEGLDALCRLGEHLGLWAKTRGFPPPGAEYEARTTFLLDHLPDDLTLVYEDLGEPARFELNGRELTAAPQAGVGWDPACRGLALAGYARRGKNHLTMRSRQPAFTALPPDLTTLEPVALYGSFGLRGRTVAAPDASPAAGGDWTERGFRFYSGPLRLRTRFSLPAEYLDYELWLELGDVRECAEAWLNGARAGVRIYPPFNFDITDLARAGENELEVRVVNTAANLLGRPRPSGLLSAIRIAAFAGEALP